MSDPVSDGRVVNQNFSITAPSRRSYLHVASRIFNTPLLIDPRKLEAIVHAIGPRMGVDLAAPAAAWPPEKQAFDGPYQDWDGKDFLTVSEGVAILEVTGTLVHKGAWLGSYSGLTSYDGLSEQLARIVGRNDVRALLLNVHSGGGEVAGCFDLVDQIHELRGSMPIVALAADAASSAAYAIASAADEVIVTQTGEVGSIGVVLTHFDYSRMAEEMGVAVTHIYAGKDKVLGSPYKPLSDADRRKLQAEVDTLYELFVTKVSRNRGLDADAVRSTEARIFLAEEAVKTGLADRIASGRQVLEELKQRVALGAASPFRTFNNGDTSMTTANQQPNGAASNNSAATAEQLAAARTEGRAEGLAEGTAAGAAAERGRIKGILTHADAEGRTELAQHLAFDTDMTAEAATALLGKTPKSVPASVKTPLEAAMAAVGTPGIRSEEVPTGAEPTTIDANAIFAARRAAAGK